MDEFTRILYTEKIKNISSIDEKSDLTATMLDILKSSSDDILDVATFKLLCMIFSTSTKKKFKKRARYSAKLHKGYESYYIAKQFMDFSIDLLDDCGSLTEIKNVFEHVPFAIDKIKTHPTSTFEIILDGHRYELHMLGADQIKDNLNLSTAPIVIDQWTFVLEDFFTERN